MKLVIHPTVMKKSECYRAILKQEFLSRKNANRYYTQASFARDIGIAPPKLSQILSKKCGLSKKRALKVAENLGFNEEETTYFASLVSSQHGRSRTEREQALKRAEALTTKASVTLSADQFDLLKDWHHFAILNLLKSKDVERDEKSLSRRLQLPVGIVRKSLELLEKLHLLGENGEGELVKTTQDIPSRAIRHHHEQVIKKALEGLERTPVSEREFQSLMFVADASTMGEMKKALRQQSFQFMKSFESEEATDLYSLSVQLVPLTIGGKQ